MEKFKVKVTNKSEVFEIEKILSTIGLIGRNYSGFSYPKYMANNIDGVFSDYTMSDSGINKFKLLTINELKDMVVLKRNNPKDATHEFFHIGSYKPTLIYADCNNKTYCWGGQKWIHKTYNINVLKPMGKKAMKEYLDPDNGYDFIKWTGFAHPPESFIEVPEGAEILTVILGDNVFYKSGNPWKWYSKESKKWMECSDIVGLDGFQNVLWQRGKEPLNDQVVTAEVARQEEKHGHYKKDVSHLSVIDPYRISDLYNLHPCADHIMKKSLCAGNRGHKDMLQDIQDIIDTAERWKQMIEEDSNEI